MITFESTKEVTYNITTRPKKGFVQLVIQGIELKGNDGVDTVIIKGNWREKNGKVIPFTSLAKRPYRVEEIEALQSNLPNFQETHDIGTVTLERLEQLTYALIDMEYSLNNESNFGLQSSDLIKL